MKKIVGILAAAALLATSVFAVDFSGGVRLEGDLFKYDGKAEGVSALMLKNNNQFYHAPLALSVTSDRAGATIKFTDKDSNAFTTDKWNIWFKPMDMLKVNLGSIEDHMHRETIDYSASVVDADYDNFGASLNVEVDAFTLSVAVVPGKGKYWFQDGKTQLAANLDEAIKADYEAWEKTDAGKAATDEQKEAKKAALKVLAILAKPSLATEPDAALGELNFVANYAADFGEIRAMFDFKKTFKDITMAAGYKNTFGDLTLWADAGINMAKNAAGDFVNTVGVAADVIYAKDALNAQACVKWTSGLKDISKDTMKVYTVAKVAYTLDQGTVYAYFKDANLLAKDFTCTIKPGFTSSVGIMDYEIAVAFDIAKKVTVSVPVNFKVAF